GTPSSVVVRRKRLVTRATTAMRPPASQGHNGRSEVGGCRERIKEEERNDEEEEERVAMVVSGRSNERRNENDAGDGGFWENRERFGGWLGAVGEERG
ncbi:hypothetical protein HAX54_008223, partial [Datura stramonium]|nr:hypothetical protein [Datura stramonium]